jgi:hypothetical protein
VEGNLCTGADINLPYHFLMLTVIWTMQTAHWNEKRKIQQFYSELAAKELADEQARKAELSAKLSELEAALAD